MNRGIMAILERLARAETSSDLSHKWDVCDVDLLGAVGLAGIHNPGKLAVFRLKYINDKESLHESRLQFIRWVRRAMKARRMDIMAVSRCADQALKAWVEDSCKPCKGLGYAVLPGTPHLSDQQCPRCHGAGKTPITGPFREPIKDALSMADSAVHEIQQLIRSRL
jgi:hypothetical protein